MTLVGKKGTGKSQMLAHRVGCITDGKKFFRGVAAKVRGEVVIFHGEHSIESTPVLRLIAAGVTKWHETVHLPRAETLEDAVVTVRTLIAEHKKIKIVFIDPLNLSSRRPCDDGPRLEIRHPPTRS